MDVVGEGAGGANKAKPREMEDGGGVVGVGGEAMQVRTGMAAGKAKRRREGDGFI